MNVGDKVTFQGLEGRTHEAEIVAIHVDLTNLDAVDLRIVGTERPLKRIARDDSKTPHPFTWRPA